MSPRLGSREFWTKEQEQSKQSVVTHDYRCQRSYQGVQTQGSQGRLQLVPQSPSHYGESGSSVMVMVLANTNHEWNSGRDDPSSAAVLTVNALSNM